MNKITMMRIRELNAKILNEKGKIQKASIQLKILEEQLNKVKENK